MSPMILWVFVFISIMIFIGSLFGAWKTADWLKANTSLNGGLAFVACFAFWFALLSFTQWANQ